MDISQIKKLIQLLNDNNLGELIIKEGDLKITLRHKDYQKTATVVSGSVAAVPSVAAVTTPIAPAADTNTKKETAPVTDGLSAIKAPMIGTFYRASSPEKEPFVKVGDLVKKGQVLCVIEAMKLFNEIQSEISGKIIKVMVDNGQAVEYDQPLFFIEPQ